MQTLPLSDNISVESYTPGLHILAELKNINPDPLIDFSGIKKFLYHQIELNSLTALGEVFHNFENGGYTGVICLTESHLAIHTWPEFGLVTLDVYLSNYRKSNDEIARSIIKHTIEFFNCSQYNLKEFKR